MKKPLLLGIILTVCVVIVAFVFAQFYPEGMISYWKFDEAGGITASDSDDANDGALVNEPGWTTGQVGGALSFDGVNDYVEVPDSDSLDVTGPITLEAWIYRTKANAWQGIIAKFSGELNKRSYLLYVSKSNKLALLISSTGLQATPTGANWNYIFGTSDIPLNAWVHVMGTYDGSYLRVYINGSLNGEKPATIDPTYVSDAPLRIGVFTQSAPYGSLHFGGMIDEVAIYDRALSYEEIQQHYQDGLHGLGYDVECVTPPSGMVSWWPGDGNADDIIDDYNGTLEGGTTYAPGRIGQAFLFSEPGDMITVEHDPNLNLESLPNATFEGWFKSNSGNDALIVAKHFCGNASGWFFTTGQGGYIGDHWVGGYGVGGRNLNDGNFHHFAIVKNGTYYYEYIDGVEISQDTGPSVGTPAPNDVHLQIGSINTGTCSLYPVQLYGLVDEVSLYDRALPQSEIQGIYLAGSAGKCTNQPPVAMCKDIVISVDENCKAFITPADVDDESYDPDEGDTIELSVDNTGPFSPGVYTVYLTVTDENEASATCLATVNVEDTTPPEIISVSVSPSILWPPNHKMVAVNLSTSVSDNCDPGPECQIIAVSSNEPENGLGDGDKAPDWEITGDLTVKLRAERSGTGSGRIYTITVQCMDESGNSSTENMTVTVPHDKKKK